jgi:CDP-6-deoxy-D-xylo-4-hexulose-3-dehydrase
MPDTKSARALQLREKILDLVTEFYAEEFPSKPFVPGETPVPVSGRVFFEDDVRNLVDASLDFWLTTGRYGVEFEKSFAKFFDVRSASLVNSGSSANLVALSCLTSPKLEEGTAPAQVRGRPYLRPGDEVITVAAGFPTTVNPIIQNRLVPVFVDAAPPTYQAATENIEAALSPRTRAVMIAHTLGNPCDLDAVAAFCRRNNLWLIEDCCDALGATYAGKKAGTFGDLATFSFYPAHHITMGEGGCVITDTPVLKTLAESFRDWGRDCWCMPGKDNTCGKRFDWQLGELPHGYDHKYIYSHIGYNLKATDMQAAVGVSQLRKLPRFIETRRRNFEYLMRKLKPVEDVLILPEATPNSEPSWFGMPLAVRPGTITRAGLVRHLDARKVHTRQVFAGNLVRQPAYKGVSYRVVGELSGADFIMENAFWIGVYPGLTEEMLDYVVKSITEYARNPV